MPDYPSTLPLPQAEDYGHSVLSGNTAVKFEHGNTRQRAKMSANQYYFNLAFVLTTAQLAAWQIWATRYGYDWHSIVLTGKPFLSSTSLLPTTLRYVSDITIEPLSGNYFKATVTAETA